MFAVSHTLRMAMISHTCAQVALHQNGLIVTDMFLVLETVPEPNTKPYKNQSSHISFFYTLSFYRRSPPISFQLSMAGNSKASKHEYRDLRYFPSGSRIRLQISRFTVLCRVLVSSNLPLVLRRVQNKRQRTEPSSPLLMLEFHAISSSSLSLCQLLRLIFKALIESEYEKPIFAALYEGQGGPVQRSKPKLKLQLLCIFYGLV